MGRVIKKQRKLKVFTYLALSVFVSIILLSGVEIVVANGDVAPQGAVSSDSGVRLVARKLYDEAMILYRQGTAESLRSCIEKLFEALKLYNKIDDKQWQALSSNFIGQVYSTTGDKQQALKYLTQALLLFKEMRDKLGQATTLNNIGLVYDGSGDKQQALKYYYQSLPLSIEIGDSSGQATTLNNIGAVYNSLGDKQQALKFYNKSLPLWMGDKAGQAATLGNIGKVYNDLGDKQQALKFYNQALTLYTEVDNKTGQASTLTYIGSIYIALKDNQQALEYLNQALPLFRELEDKVELANILVSIGILYTASGDKQQALKFYNQALPLKIEVEGKKGQAVTLDFIGDVYDATGDNQQALNKFNQALSLYIEVGDKKGQATAFNKIGGIYFNIGDNLQALKYFNQALPLFTEMRDKQGQANTLDSFGVAISALGDSQQSLKFFNKALSLLIELGNKGEQAATLSNIGKVYSDSGDKKQALKYLKQALPLSIEASSEIVQARILHNIGAIYYDLGDRQQAFKFYNQALPLSIKTGNKQGQAFTLWNLANIERDKGNLEQSFKQIQTAIEIIEKLHKTYTNKDLQSTYFAKMHFYYQFYIDLLMQLDKKHPSKRYDTLAFNVSERSRARTLVDLLAEANANIRKGVDPKLLASEQLVLGEIEAVQKQMQDPSISNDEAKREKLEQKNKNLLNQHSEVIDKIRINSPQYAAIQYPQPLELKQIQQQLDKDTLLLQYSLGKDRSYLWAVTPDSFQAYELPKNSEIESFVEDFRSTITDSLSVTHPAKATKLTKLSQIILAPVANQLGKKRLAIVADGALQTIPFAALSDPTIKAPSYQPLIVNHEIVNLPSFTAIATQRQRFNNRKVAPYTLAVLADPIFDGNDERVTGKPPTLAPELNLDRSSLQRALKNIKRNGMARLKGTRAEALEILKLVSPQEAIHAYDFDANYDFVTNPELKKYRFLLFATHGIVDTTNPELSGIVLSQVDKQGKPVEKGYLRLGDIFNLDLGAELVVLSACDTGLGKDIKGEGLVGLTRGLMYAGSKRAVVSLWQVSDEGTSKLMPIFYKAVLQGKAPTVALREAQLQLWNSKKWRSPYYWAAFTLQGDWK